MSTERDDLVRNARRIVIKIGSALLTDPDKGLDRAKIEGYCTALVGALHEDREIILVSSGAVAEGCVRLGLSARPETVHELQAAAAVGQMGLVEAYERALARDDCKTAMIMLTHDDLANRRRYLNARATLKELLKRRVIPIINENDTVATDEIRFGDNDTLAALVANLMDADLLVILTDVDGLMTADPRLNADAQRVDRAAANDPSLDAYAGSAPGALGRGGMVTKLKAARIAARAGAHTIIASGADSSGLVDLLAGADRGTLLTAQVSPLTARKLWIAGQLKPRGELVVDGGAAERLKDRQGVSLLAVGVSGASGDFRRGDLVRIVDPNGTAIAQGLVNYEVADVRRLFGVRSEQFGEHIEAVAEPELVHRDNLVVL